MQQFCISSFLLAWKQTPDIELNIAFLSMSHLESMSLQLASLEHKVLNCLCASVWLNLKEMFSATMLDTFPSEKRIEWLSKALFRYLWAFAGHWPRTCALSLVTILEHLLLYLTLDGTKKDSPKSFYTIYIYSSKVSLSFFFFYLETKCFFFLLLKQKNSQGRFPGKTRIY